MTDIAPTAPQGAALLRVTLGVLFFAHAWLGLFVKGPAAGVAMFTGFGLPGALAYLTIAAELVGGVALVLGIYARIVALALVPLILGTIVLVHGANGFFFDDPKGGWEFPAVWAAMLIVQFLIGDGAAALFPTRILRKA